MILKLFRRQKAVLRTFGMLIKSYRKIKIVAVRIFFDLSIFIHIIVTRLCRAAWSLFFALVENINKTKWREKTRRKTPSKIESKYSVILWMITTDKNIFTGTKLFCSVNWDDFIDLDTMPLLMCDFVSNKMKRQNWFFISRAQQKPNFEKQKNEEQKVGQ